MSSFVPKLQTQRNIYERKQNPLGSTTAIGRAVVGSGLTSYLFSEQAKKFLLIAFGFLSILTNFTSKSLCHAKLLLFNLCINFYFKLNLNHIIKRLSC